MSSPGPSSKATWDKIPAFFDEHVPSEKAKWVNLETIAFPYSPTTMNYFCEIAYFCERLNFGSYTLFRIFWDILKRGFHLLTSENQLRLLRMLCESNLNLPFFQHEVEYLMHAFVSRDQGSSACARQMNWDSGPCTNLLGPEAPKFDPRLEFFNTVYATK